MNILISVTDLCVGGGQNFALRLAKSLAHKHSVILFNYETFQKRCDKLHIGELPDNLRIVSLPAYVYWLLKAIDSVFYRVGIKSQAWYFFQKIYLKFLISLYRIDVVNSHLYNSDDFVVDALNHSETPIVISDHGDYRYVLEQGLSNLEKINQIFDRADAIAYPSCSNAKIASKFIGHSGTVETVIYYGFPTRPHQSYSESARQKLGISAKAFVFGMVARGIPEKGWGEAIQAFRLVQSLSNDDFHLVLVGGGDYLSTLENELKLQAIPNLHFTGYSSDPNYWIECFDVGLLPTYFSGESLPNSVIEYLFLKKPVIATDVGGIPEMIAVGEEQAGFIINLTQDGKGDVSKLADAMSSYIKNADLLAAHAHLAKQAFEKFNMQICIESYETLFQQVVSKYSNGSYENSPSKHV